jgi:GAF domain
VVEAHVIPALGGVAGGLMVLAEGGEHLDVVARTGYPSEYAAQYARHALSAPLPSAEAVRTGQPVYYESLAELAQRFPDVASKSAGLGYEAGAVAPLLGRAGPFGAVALLGLRPGARSRGQHTGGLWPALDQAGRARGAVRGHRVIPGAPA